MKDFDRVQIESRAELRAWLEANQARTEAIWLVTFKKHVPDKYVSWQEVVEEALGYGWIDSRTRKVDDDRTMYLLSPRRAGSPWSRRNGHLRPPPRGLLGVPVWPEDRSDPTPRQPRGSRHGPHPSGLAAKPGLPPGR